MLGYLFTLACLSTIFISLTVYWVWLWNEEDEDQLKMHKLTNDEWEARLKAKGIDLKAMAEKEHQADMLLFESNGYEEVMYYDEDPEVQKAIEDYDKYGYDMGPTEPCDCGECRHCTFAPIPRSEDHFGTNTFPDGFSDGSYDHDGEACMSEYYIDDDIPF